MKKMMSILIAVLWMLLLTCSSTASAYPTEIKYGTPIIDGQLDDMYRKSASTSIDTQGTYTWGGTSQNDAYVITYYLWDDQYLYVCCIAYDTDLLDVGEARYQAYPATWTAECVEVFFNTGDGRWKIHMDAFGHAFYFGDNRDGAANPFNGATDKEYYPQPSEYQAAVSFLDGGYGNEYDGYIAEFAIPFSHLTEGVSFTTSTQIVDMTALGGDMEAPIYGEGYCSSTYDYVLTLIADSEESTSDQNITSDVDITSEDTSLTTNFISDDMVETGNEILHDKMQTTLTMVIVGATLVLIGLLLFLFLRKRNKKNV